MSAPDPADAGGGTPGWYGKLPAAGDFLTRRLPGSFVQTWDHWLQHGLAQGRDRFGPIDILINNAGAATSAPFLETDADAFRTEARDWLTANFPPSLAGVDVAMMNATGPVEGDADGAGNRLHDAAQIGLGAAAIGFDEGKVGGCAVAHANLLVEFGDPDGWQAGFVIRPVLEPKRLQSSASGLEEGNDPGEIIGASGTMIDSDGPHVTVVGADNLVIVVVGDRKQIDEQIATLEMPVEYLEADKL